MATATTTFNLYQIHFESIVDMAGHGIGYWAHTLVIDNTGTDGEYVSYSVTDAGEGERTFVLTREMVEQAALDLYVKAPLNDYYQNAIRQLVVNNDSYNVGSDIADAIIQYACFGEVIYG